MKTLKRDLFLITADDGAKYYAAALSISEAVELFEDRYYDYNVVAIGYVDDVTVQAETEGEKA